MRSSIFERAVFPVKHERLTEEEQRRREDRSRKWREGHSESERKAWGAKMKAAREAKKARLAAGDVDNSVERVEKSVSPHVSTGDRLAPRAWPAMVVPGHFWFQNAYRLLLEELVAKGGPRVWVEVGVFQGQSLAWLGREVLTRGLDVTIRGVDTFDGWTGTLRGKALRDAFDGYTGDLGNALGDRWHVHEMSSVRGSCLFRPKSVDVVWLDADHTYDAVRRDINAWQPNVQEGGVIGGDDFSFEETSRAVRSTGKYELVPGEREGGPWPSWIRRIPVREV